jgi:hypothetical protein
MFARADGRRLEPQESPEIIEPDDEDDEPDDEWDDEDDEDEGEEDEEEEGWRVGGTEPV